MDSRKPLRLDTICAILTDRVADAQAMIDASFVRDLRLVVEAVDRSSASEPAQAFAMAMPIAPLRLVELQLAVDFVLEAQSARSGEIGLAIFGSSVHRFYHQRFGAGQSSTSRIEIHCQASAPAYPASTVLEQNEEQHHGN